MIVHKGNKWMVMDSKGKKVLGTHYSKKDAQDQLAAIEISKNKNMKESSNFLNNSMANLTEYYKQLCEDLKIQRMVLEQLLQEAKKKKKKKADKDYDGDGKVESGSEEYLGSRSNAIKKAIAKREGKELNELYWPEAEKKYPRYNYNTAKTLPKYQLSGSDEPKEFDKLGMPIGRPDFVKGEGYWEKDPDHFGGPKGRWRWVSGRNPVTDALMAHFRGEKSSGISKTLPKMGETDNIIDIRRKAAEMGGITDDMVNEPIPGSSTLPGKDLSGIGLSQDQIDAANRNQSGQFGKRKTFGPQIIDKKMPPSKNPVPYQRPIVGTNVKDDPFFYGRAKKVSSSDMTGQPRNQNSSFTDLARSISDFLSNIRPGKVRNPTGDLVDRYEVIGTTKRGQIPLGKVRRLYSGELGPRIPGDGSLEDRYPDMFRPKPAQRGLWDIGRTNPGMEARDEVDMRKYYQNKYS
jgi:hypothetical protein